MKTFSYRMSMLSMLAAVVPAVAQDRDQPAIPPPPGTSATAEEADQPARSAAPRTFIEEAPPASPGAAVASSADGKLVVTDLVAGSAAANAGVREGDVVVSIDGHLITEVDGFNQYFVSHPAQPVNLVVMRDGIQRTIVLFEATPNSTASEIRPALGVRFIQGPQVIVAEVVVGSPADRAGLQPGDQLVALNGDVLSSTDHFITLVAAVPYDKTLELTYVRNQERRWAAIEPAAWDVVFGSTTSRVALKPSVTDSRVVATPSITCCSAPFFTTNVSPVVVPAAWYYPYYPAYAWYYWGYPYYAYYPGYYYPYWPYAPHGPYVWPHADYPRTHSAPATRIDSAQTAPSQENARRMATSVPTTERLQIVEQQ